MRALCLCVLPLAGLTLPTCQTAEVAPAPQAFEQEVATRYTSANGLPEGSIRLVDRGPNDKVRAFARGRWFELDQGSWRAAPGLAAPSEGEFAFVGASGAPTTISIPWREIRQVLRRDGKVWIATEADPFAVTGGQARSLGWPSKYRVNQIAARADGALLVASQAGLFRQVESGWVPMGIIDDLGRAWAVRDVRGVAIDARDRPWFATKAGVGCLTAEGWRFYEGTDGLPWNDFTGVVAGKGDELWFGTRLGAIRFDGETWHYRQGPRWLPSDEVRQIAVDANGDAWLATSGGVGLIARKPMTLAEKAAFYEEEIERYVKRTPFGFVAEAYLREVANKASADPHDSDNDGLWTAMYGAGECFAYAATKDQRAKQRARQAFEALRFLQKVTQGGAHAPPKGYVARTIRSVDLPDPNEGRLARDRRSQQGDKLWKIYEPRWPKSADGKWFWKSDTSSDELDGHYFFYPLYLDFCAETDAEKARVREVVRDLTDHLLAHDYVLIDHDGRPTRWAIFDPQYLNRDPNWWAERGLNSLSILTYLAVAAHVTGDEKYEAASRELVEEHGYAQNLLYPKAQHGPGSGNQSDDEMAFMCYYSLLRYSKDEALKAQVRFSFFRCWANEAPEMNPFFNFAYAAHNRHATVENSWGTFSLTPWGEWQEDAMATLHGFPLDRLNWPHRNRHRLDLRLLRLQASPDLYEASRGERGYRVGGKVLPVENRHFNHWNTDPWRLDYGGQGNELGAGTVFLLPYYLGMYHGFIERP